MKKLLIFASGSKDGGGSGFEKLVENAKTGILEAEIVGVVSNHAEGGVAQKAKKLGVPFFHFAGPYTPENYQELVKRTEADFIALSGWLKLVSGLPPERTFNIHPGPLPRFGGPGMYGHHVHEAVIKAAQDGLKYSEVTMHFVTEKYDEGPVFFRGRVLISENETAETLGKRVNEAEHAFQSRITSLVVNGKIRWDGKDRKTLNKEVVWFFPLKEE